MATELLVIHAEATKRQRIARRSIVDGARRVGLSLDEIAAALDEDER